MIVGDDKIAMAMAMGMAIADSLGCDAIERLLACDSEAGAFDSRKAKSYSKMRAEGAFIGTEL